jgi:TolB-like protein
LTERSEPLRIVLKVTDAKRIGLGAHGRRTGNVIWGEPRFLKFDPSTVTPPPPPPPLPVPALPVAGKVLRLDPEKITQLAEALKARVEKDPDLKGLRPTLALASFTLIPAGGLSASNADNVREDLSTALIDTGAFDFVERAQLNKAFAELNLASSDLIDSASAQKLGKLVNARTVLIGSISDRGTYTVINARIVDTETGRIRIAASVELRQ